MFLDERVVRPLTAGAHVAFTAATRGGGFGKRGIAVKSLSLNSNNCKGTGVSGIHRWNKRCIFGGSFFRHYAVPSDAELCGKHSSRNNGGSMPLFLRLIRFLSIH